ncbi:hypothetical protein C8J56DRAFT_925927 [Mycena floridula]|nr:hypothetical protein C8J56DRAFT_925927 [Mycena floridula]
MLPVLLESFPTPPSFLPQVSYPPLSAPPSSPLPPVPGPSRISEADTFALLTASRRSSKFSVASSNRPDSIASNTSSSGLAGGRDSISSSLSSHSHSLSLHPEPQKGLLFPSLPSPSRSPYNQEDLTLRDLQDEFPQVPFPHSPSQPDLSISSVSMQDLPPSDNFEDLSSSEPPKLRSSRKSLFSSLPAKPSSIAPSSDLRPVSPDISSLLSQTPRPKRSVSRPRVSSRTSRKSGERYTSRSPSASGEDLWEEDQFIEDYGVRVSGRFSGLGSSFSVDPEPGFNSEMMNAAFLQDEPDDDGTDSDSSLDLHTPLPHLMLKHGLLSPNSKLLDRPKTHSTPQDGRPGSVLSVVSNADSVMTKTGIMKDSRDTPRRRVRHRDGKLLKGGIGLTTGLGWSDSEDEDAPSALTRQISVLNLARRSTPSLRSSHSFRSSSFSRASSSHQTRSFSLYDDDDDDFTSNHSRHDSSRSSSKTPSRLRAQTTLPPTSWHKMPSTLSGRSSIRSSASTDSVLSLSIPDHRSPNGTSRIRSQGDEFARTPSTASSLSLILPVTPEDEGFLQSSGQFSADREKMLPSLPNPRTGSIKRYASHVNLKRPAPIIPPTLEEVSHPRQRSQSSASSGSTSTSSSRLDSNYQSVPASGLPRSLRLSPGIPIPALPSGLRYSGSRPTLRPTATAPSTPTSSAATFTPGFKSRPRMSEPSQIKSSISPAPAGVPVPRPKPRIGTGMVYRSSTAGIGIAL